MAAIGSLAQSPVVLQIYCLSQYSPPALFFDSHKKICSISYLGYCVVKIKDASLVFVK